MEPTNWSVIFNYGIQMSIAFVAGMLFFAIFSLRTKPAIVDYCSANGLRLFLAFTNFWVVSAGLVLVPNFAQILGSFGFNADQSPVGIAGLIVLAFIKTEG